MVNELIVDSALLVGAVLGVAALVIGALTPSLRRRKPALARELWLRTIAWAVIAALFLGALALGRVGWIALVTLLSVAAVREYARAVGLWSDRAFLAVAYLSVLAINVCVWWPYDEASSAGPGWYGLFLVMPIYGVLATMAVPIARGTYEGMVQRLALTILAIIYFGWFLAHFGYLLNLEGGLGLVLFLGILVAVNDVAAFVTGKAFGRHKLRPNLSPGKTVEGALGSLVVVVAAAWWLDWLVPLYEPRWTLPLVAGLVSIAGTLGDLALSVIKRDVGIKDWGEGVPGHGGVLDRANSLLFTVPLFFHITRFFFL